MANRKLGELLARLMPTRNDRVYALGVDGKDYQLLLSQIADLANIPTAQVAGLDALLAAKLAADLSALPNGGPVDTADQFVVRRGGMNFKVPLSAILNTINGRPLTGYRVVDQRGAMNYATTAISGVNATMEGRFRSRITAAGLPAVRYLFDNWYPTGNIPVVETDNATALPLNTGLELDALGSYAKALLNGTDMVIPASSRFTASDEILASSFGLGSYPQYAVYWQRVSSQIAAGTWLQGQKRLDLAGEFAFRHNPPALQAYGTGAMTQYGGSGQRAYLPICLIGQPTDPNYKALLGIGDSRMQGEADTRDTVEGGVGVLQRACMFDGTKGYASLNLGRNGDSVYQLNQGRSRREALFPLCTHALIWYGFNDFTQGRTYAQVLADTEALADLLRNTYGYKKVGVINQPPYTTGTWGSEATQTVSAPVATNINGLNAAYAANANGKFDGVVDAHSAVCGVNPDKWAAGLTGDGIHANGAGTALIVPGAKALLTTWGF